MRVRLDVKNRFIEIRDRRVAVFRHRAHAVDAQSSRGLRNRNVRTTERPAAAERQIHAHPELFRHLRRESQHVQKFLRQIRVVVLERQRIHRLHLEPSDARGFHLTHFALDFRFGLRWAEPPPAHHDARIIRRMRKRGAQIGHRRRGSRIRQREQQRVTHLAPGRAQVITVSDDHGRQHQQQQAHEQKPHRQRAGASPLFQAEPPQAAEDDDARHVQRPA